MRRTTIHCNWDNGLNSFGTFITEASTPGKNTHLTHLEDVILDDGPSGVSFAVKLLYEFGRVLNGGNVSKSLNVSVKWDGAPALIFGPDPADGRFFVATKSAFAKNPKLAKSHADIDAMYQSGVNAVLHVALDELSKTAPKVVLQGDILFTSSTLSVQDIDGQAFLTFQPNTILYAVDRNSALGAQIAQSTIGIVVHTMYTGRGNSLADYTSSPVTPTAYSSMRRIRTALVMDAHYDDVSGTATFTAQERSDYYLAIEAVRGAARAVGPNVYSAVLEEPLHAHLQQFVNALVRQGRRAKPQDMYTQFRIFLEERRQREVATRKTPEAKNVIDQRYAAMVATVSRERKGFIAWFTLHAAIQRAKDIVVRKLGQASRVASFVRTDAGLRSTGPEGFVAVARDGKAVKLVDRLEFSKLNFQATKSWS
jgi:hypothetical protein